MIPKIKIIDLLTTLTKEEVIDFQRFIQSPFFHKGIMQKEMGVLLEYLNELKFIDSGEDQEVFDRKNAFDRVYPNQPFVEKKIEKVLSALHIALKDFTAFNAFSQPDFQINRQLLQLAYLREKNLQNRYKNLSSTVWEGLNALPTESVPNLRLGFELNYETFIFEIQHNVKNAHLRFQGVLEDLEVSYLANKIELLNLYLTTSYFSASSLPEEIESIIQHSYFPQKLIEQHPLLLLTYNVFLLLKSRDASVDSVSDLHNLFIQNESKINPGKIRQFSTLLRNVCVLGTMKRRYEFYPLLFQLSKEHYEKGYLHHDGKITASSLISISQTALINKAFDWCESFIRDQQDKILNDTPEQDFYHLALANFYTFNGQFEEALAVVPATMPTSDNHLLAKRIELKCYYETKSPLLDAKIDAFRMFLSRISKNQISEQLHQSNSNFLNILNQIHMAIPGDKQRNLKILERINEKEYLFDRDWLIEKAKMR
jgi:hypothetical protein